MKNAVAPSRINAPDDEAAQARARQAADHRKIIQRHEAAVWRRHEAVLAARRPEAIARAKRKLEAAQDKLLKVKIEGSPTREPDVLTMQRRNARRQNSR